MHVHFLSGKQTVCFYYMCIYVWGLYHKLATFIMTEIKHLQYELNALCDCVIMCYY